MTHLDLAERTASADAPGPNSPGPSVLFLVYREVLGPIFSSVYLKPAARLRQIAFSINICAVVSAGEVLRPSLRRRWREFSRDIRQTFPPGVVRILSLPNRIKRFAVDRFAIALWWRWSRLRRETDVVHCGGVDATVLAIHLRKRYPGPRIVYHCWGPAAAEYRASQRYRPDAPLNQVERRAREIEANERQAMRHADIVMCISAPMAKWANTHYGVEPERIFEMPCVVDVGHFAGQAAQRNDVRAELGYEGKFVIAYCGSMIPWQLPPGSLRIISALCRARADIRFLGLTMHARSLIVALEQYSTPADRVAVRTVAPRDVPRYLAAADLGIIGRGLTEGPDLIHQTSSPIKFGEYLACGTPVLIGAGVGEFSDCVADRELGLVLPHHAAVDESISALLAFREDYAADRDAIRARCERFCRERLDLGVHVGRLAALYRRLAAGPARVDLHLMHKR